MTGIYKITSPTGRIYIGQSNNINRRCKRYMNLDISVKKQPRLYNSLKKHGVEKHIFEVKEECLFEELNLKERYWQDYYDVLGKNGLNCVLTDTNILPKKYSERAKRKMSKSRRGIKVSEKTREKMSIAFSGENNPFYGKIHSEEALDKMKENSFKLTLIDVETKEIFEGLKKASEKTGITFSTLQRIFSGKRENNTNLRLIEDYNENINYEIVNHIKSLVGKRVINNITGEVFMTAKEAYLQSKSTYTYRHFIKMLNGSVKNKTNFNYKNNNSC